MNPVDGTEPGNGPSLRSVHGPASAVRRRVSGSCSEQIDAGFLPAGGRQETRITVPGIRRPAAGRG
jgi:hypothetical protein